MDAPRLRSIALVVVVALAVAVTSIGAVLEVRDYVVARDEQARVSRRLDQVQSTIHVALGSPFTELPADVPEPSPDELAAAEDAIDRLRADRDLFAPGTVSAIQGNWELAQAGGRDLLVGGTQIDAVIDRTRGELVPVYMERSEDAARRAVVAVALAAVALAAAAMALLWALVSRSRRRARATTERFFASMLENLTDRVCRFRTDDLTITYCNEAWASPLGLTPDEAVGRRLADFVDGDVRAGVDRVVADRTAGRPGRPAEAPLRLADGTVRLELWQDHLVDGPDGPEIVAIGRDITERAEAEQALAASERRFRSLADRASDVVFRVRGGPEPELLYLNDAVTELTGIPRGELLARPLEAVLALVPPGDLDGFERFVERFFEPGLAAQVFETRLVRPDGEVRWVDVRRTASTTRDGEVVIDGSARDITAAKRAEAELARLAHQDALTGLPNRRALVEALGQRIDEGRSVAVLFVDLDGFKDVNDTLGHDAGDRVLAQAALRLAGCCRSDDVVARLGGDEFVVLTDPEHAPLLAQRLVDALGEPLSFGGRSHVVTASVGVAVAGPGTSPATLIARADEAMYAAKAAGKDQVHLGEGAARA